MTPIPAKVLAVDKQGDQHNVIVRIGLAKYRGSFNTLAFGESKPFHGTCHNGQLDLFYYRDPGLKTGKSFPLWTIMLTLVTLLVIPGRWRYCRSSENCRIASISEDERNRDQRYDLVTGSDPAWFNANRTSLPFFPASSREVMGFSYHRLDWQD